MPTNKNSQLHYQIFDRCFSDFHRKYFIEDLMDKVNDALMDLYGTLISIRQIREDIKYMKVASLRSTIDILGRFRGVPTNAWREDVISNLEFRFGAIKNVFFCAGRLQHSTLILYRI